MKLIGIVIIFIITSCIAAFSQPECTTNCTNGTAWTAGTAPITIVLIAPDCKIVIDYEWRICDNVYEYRYTNFVAQGNCTQMADFSIYQYSISSILEMADMIVAEETYQMDGHTPIGLLPNCGTGVFKKAKFYNAACGVWVKCSYIIDQNAEVKKDRGYEGSCEIPDQNGYIHKWKWQSCGDACCRREYDICQFTSPASGTLEVKVTQYPAVMIGQCTQQGNYGPWEVTDPMAPNYNYNCQHACNN